MDYQNIFNRDFYTTPREVFDIMTTGEDLTDAVVLEPSAGSGNLVRFCQESGARYVKACEINDTLRDALFSRCCVIAPDFLTVRREQVADVTHIIMNPPFTNVERHILHAWDIAPDGCTIIALCPSSRFSSCYGEGKKLAETIELFGTREDVGDVFNTATADRRTAADISVIRLYKPSEKSQDFEGLEWDTTPEGFDDLGNGQEGLIRYDALRDMVKRYNSALAQFDAVQEASKRINEDIAAFSACSIHFGAHGTDRNRNDLSNINRDRFRKELQHAAWAKVFSLLQMQKYTTSVLEQKIARFVESSEARPFTLKNIYLVVSDVIQNVGNIMNECVVRAFDTICELSAENTTAGEKWKTNSNYMVNQRFIVDGIRTEYTSGSHYDYKLGKYVENPHLRTSWTCYRDNIEKVEDLYKSLCFVSGKQYDDKHNRAFESDVIQHCDNFGTWFYFDWFRVRFYKKGTMHFEFTDINVWYRFNQIAAQAKGWKLGSATQCKNRRIWRDIVTPNPKS